MPDAAADARAEASGPALDVESESAINNDVSSDADASSDANPSDDVDAAVDAPDDGDDGSSMVDVDPCGETGAVQRASVSGAAPQLYCTASEPCAKGLLCIGDGCDLPWICTLHGPEQGEHPCPDDYAPYCGCDGVTYMALRTCPDRPYDRYGACEDGVNCSPTKLKCPDAPEPTCPAGQVPSVAAGKYGPCVPVERCQCEFVFECPHREKYQCNATTFHCGPI
jgi:hypothetical protein